MDCSYPDGGRSCIHNINAKGYKLSNDTAFVWHYHLKSCQCYMHEEAPFWWISESLDFDILTHANCPSWIKITKTPSSIWGSKHLTCWQSDMLMCVESMSTSTNSGNHYFVNFTNDLSRYVYIHLMNCSSEKFDESKQIRSEVGKWT